MEGVRLVRKYSRDCDLKENIDLRQKRRARELSFGDFANQRLRGEDVHEIRLRAIQENN